MLLPLVVGAVVLVFEVVEKPNGVGVAEGVAPKLGKRSVPEVSFFEESKVLIARKKMQRSLCKSGMMN